MNTINRAQRIGRLLFIKKQKADIEVNRATESVDHTIAELEKTLSRLGFVLGTYAPAYSFVQVLQNQIDTLKIALNTVSEVTKHEPRSNSRQ